MPLYEYKCESCGDVFEVIQKFSDAPLAIHQGCGGTVDRLISTSALHFKGTGWYVTDYAGKDNGKKKGGEDSQPAKADSSAKPGKNGASGDSGKPAASKSDSSASSTSSTSTADKK